MTFSPPDDEIARDAAWVAAVQNGDTDAWKALVVSYLRFVRICAAFWLPLLVLDEAIVKRTFATALQRLAEWKGAQSFRSWLAEIARELIALELQQLRQRPRLDAMTQAILSQMKSDLENGATTIIAATERLAEGVAALPDDARLLLEQKYRDQISSFEIAEAREESESSLALRLFRIREHLRASLMNRGEVSDAE